MAHIIALELTDEAYERLKQSADASQTTVEEILADNVDVVLGLTPHVEIDDYPRLSNQALWLIVAQPFSPADDTRMRELQQRERLSEPERVDLARLTTEFDRWVLRRSMALKTLSERDVDIRAYLLRD